MAGRGQRKGVGKGCEKERNSGRTFPIRFLYADEGHRGSRLGFWGSSKYLRMIREGVRGRGRRNRAHQTSPTSSRLSTSSTRSKWPRSVRFRRATRHVGPPPITRIRPGRTG